MTPRDLVTWIANRRAEARSRARVWERLCLQIRANEGAAGAQEQLDNFDRSHR